MKSKPTVAFLIPFASRSAKKNWEVACAHLRQTLASIRNSADGNFCVVVAGNEKPNFSVEMDERFRFVSLTQSAPVSPLIHVNSVLDKLAKINLAWEYAKADYNPRYVMKLDADDLISSQLVDWLTRKGDAAGYLISHGWYWNDGARFFIERSETFDRICGSCLLIRSDLVECTGPFRTQTEGVLLSQENERFAKSDHYSLVPGSEFSTLLANDSHQRYAAQFCYLGHKLPVLPFPAVVYRMANVDSMSWHKKNAPISLRYRLGSLRRHRLITPNIRQEFCLPDK